MSNELDYVDSKLKELMEDDYLSEVSIVAVVFDAESENYSVLGDGCAVCASRLLLKFIKENNIGHNDE